MECSVLTLNKVAVISNICVREFGGGKFQFVIQRGHLEFILQEVIESEWIEKLILQ